VFDQLAVRVKKVVTREKNPVAACLEYMDEHPVDMIVLATRGRAGALKWIKGSTAESVARRSETVSLFVPGKGRGFVSPANGSLSLQRILVPMAHRPSPQPAVQFAARVARIVGGEVRVTLLHVGDADAVPQVALPEVSGVEWVTEVRAGDAPSQIVAEAERISANQIIMTTDGRDVLIDTLRGSHTERVIRRASCPVLSLPVTWTDEAMAGRPIGDVVHDEERRASKALKNTFRATARDVHPDRAAAVEELSARTDLMSRANQAYEKGDIAELERLRRRSPKRD
jgi:nucleotide-binding universal stress UspA family protein